MKKCNKCSEVKSLSEFRPRGDGKYRSVCRECDRKAHKEYYWNNRDEELKKNKAYRETHVDELNEKRRKRLNQNKRCSLDEEKLKRNIRKQLSKYKERYPEKIKAHSLVKSAIRNGSLSKPNKCSVCDRTGRIEGHHDDYNKPLDVVWLCQTCHLRHHGILKHEHLEPC